MSELRPRRAWWILLAIGILALATSAFLAFSPGFRLAPPVDVRRHDGGRARSRRRTRSTSHPRISGARSTAPARLADGQRSCGSAPT